MFDFCIVGGGMVGSALAVGLAQKGYQIAIVETQLPTPFESQQPPDLRVSAINVGSEQLLRELDAWQQVIDMRTTRFIGMEVWEANQEKTVFDHRMNDCEYLGHIVENRLIQIALHNRLGEYQNVTWFCGFNLDEIEESPDSVVLRQSDGKSIHARFVLGTDGGRSKVRALSNIGVQGWQYKQQALGINIHLLYGHRQVTWQQFKPSGPVAFLPLFDDYGCLVWYDSADTIASLKSLTKAELKQRILEHFPDCLGDFEVLDWASFPLTRMHANEYVKGRRVLLGDAAHTINPLAGQGVNLGFKDVRAFLNLVGETMSDSELAVQFNHYEKSRRHDNLLMMSAMDVFYKSFSNNMPLVKFMRNAALASVQKLEPIKRQVIKYALGIG